MSKQYLRQLNEIFAKNLSIAKIAKRKQIRKMAEKLDFIVDQKLQIYLLQICLPINIDSQFDSSLFQKNKLLKNGTIDQFLFPALTESGGY